MVEDVSGTGATAIVFRCLDIKTKKKKCVKSFFRDKMTKKLGQRVQSEPQLSIRSIYVVKAEEYFYDGYMNLAMPYVDGQTLRDILVMHNAIDKPHALYIALCLAQAANDLHRVGILSTDIKPENTMITSEGIAKLIDITCYEIIGKTPFLSSGTEPYASRELLERHCLTIYTDIYSIGVILYEMLIGTEEFDRMLGLWETNIKAGGMPDISFVERNYPNVAVIISKSINPNANYRYKNSDSLLNDLLSLYASVTGYASTKEKSLVLVLCSDGRELSIKEKAVIIGRNHIDSMNYYISEEHFEVGFRGNSLARIRDRESVNGTFVNGMKLNGEWMSLHDKDIIQIADVSISVKLPK